MLFKVLLLDSAFVLYCVVLVWCFVVLCGCVVIVVYGALSYYACVV